MKKLNNMKIREKLFLSYFFILLTAIITLGVYAYFQAKDLLLKRAIDFSQNTVDTFVNTTNSSIENLISSVNVVACNPSVYDIFNSFYTNYYDMYEDIKLYVDPLIKTTRSVNSDIASLAIYTDSSLTKHENFIHSLKRIQQTEWYPELKQTYEVQTYLQEDSVIFARPLIGQYDNTYESYVIITVPLERLLKASSYLDSPEAYWGLYDEEQLIVTNDIEGSKISDLKLVGINEEDYLQGHIRVDNNVVIKSKQDILGMQFYYMIPLQNIFYDTNTILKTTIAVAVGCFIVLLFTTLIISNAMISRIDQLIYKISLVQKGNLSVEITDNSLDEIGQISEAFGHMLVRIRKLINDVYLSEQRKKEMEIKLLHAQIKPHFLYNILSVINFKAVERGDKMISEVTRATSTYYRTSLNNGNYITVVDSELKNIISYIRIQQIMHDPEFQVSYDIDNSVKKYSMVNFILQPLVENSIKHGLDNKRVGLAKLAIRVRLDNEHIVFEITDNGPGMDETQIAEMMNYRSRGYGIYNVREKLSLFYGEDYTFHIQSMLLRGTTVTVKIPTSVTLHKKQEEIEKSLD